jgi:hypothetical protein
MGSRPLRRDQEGQEEGEKKMTKYNPQYKQVVEAYIKATLRALVEEFMKSKEWTDSNDLKLFLEWFEREKLG